MTSTDQELPAIEKILTSDSFAEEGVFHTMIALPGFKGQDLSGGRWTSKANVGQREPLLWFLW